MAIIDPDGLFGGDRLRRCSNIAQLHWPRLFLASDGFARLEINYAKIVGRAYPTFNPIPAEQELQACLQEYGKNFLLFIYEVDGQLWAQWDTRKELLPRYKTAADRRSPIPPEPAFTEWKRRYREEQKAFPKSFGNISGTFLHGVGVGVGGGVEKGLEKPSCAPPDGNARVNGLPLPTTLRAESSKPKKPELEVVQIGWFQQFWEAYWLHKARKPAWEKFKAKVKTEARFRAVMDAVRAQKAEMMQREPAKRPHGATWLNQERWEDDAMGPERDPRQIGYDVLTPVRLDNDEN